MREGTFSPPLRIVPSNGEPGIYNVWGINKIALDLPVDCHGNYLGFVPLDIKERDLETVSMNTITNPTPAAIRLLKAASLAPEGVAEADCQTCVYCRWKYPRFAHRPLVTPDCETINIQNVETGGRHLHSLLRQVRAKDSNPALRDLCPGVKGFPCCCACCRCDPCMNRVKRYNTTQLLNTPSRRKGVIANSMLAQAVDDDGDYDGGRNDWHDGGGFNGTEANVDACLYVMTGTVHDEDTRKRIKCLQYGTRFLVPQVLVSSAEGHTFELKSTWPYPGENLDMSISTEIQYVVLLRKIIFDEGEEATVGICDCHCPPGMRGRDMKEALERGFNFNYGETGIDKAKFWAGLVGILQGYSCIPSGNSNTNSVITCVHVELVRTALQRSRAIDTPEPKALRKTAKELSKVRGFEDFNVAQAMGLESSSASVSSASASSSSLTDINNRVPRVVVLSKHRYHATPRWKVGDITRRSSPMLRFGGVCIISSRGLIHCLSCDSRSCEHSWTGRKDINNKETDNDGEEAVDGDFEEEENLDDVYGNDEQESKEDVDVQHRVAVSSLLARAYKPRRISTRALNAPYPNPLDGGNNFRTTLPPSVCAPLFPLCDCTEATCNSGCIVTCPCGAAWSDSMTDPKLLVVLYATHALERSVVGRTCRNEECQNILPYDGREDCVTPMAYRSKSGIYYAIDSFLMADIALGFQYSPATLSEKYESMARYYDAAGCTHLLPPKSTFIHDLQLTIRNVVIPFLPSQCFTCSTCGTHSDTLVCDGKDEGILKRLAPPGNFNRDPKILPPPSIDNPNILRVNTPHCRGMEKQQIGLPTCPSLLLQISVPFRDLAFFSGGGNETKIQELLLQFLHADPAEKHKKFDSNSMYTLLEMLTATKRHHNAIRYVIENVKAPDDDGEEISAPPLLGNVLQCIVSKSIAPITGAPGPHIIAAYCYLSMGFSGSIRLPSFLADMTSPMKDSLATARRLINNEAQGNRNESEIADSINVHMTTINSSLPPIPGDLSYELKEHAQNARKDALMIYRDFLRKCLKTPILPVYEADVHSVTVVAAIETFFPQLAMYLCEDYQVSPSSEVLIIPPAVRPLLVQMAEKSAKLWTRNLHYYVLRKDWQGTLMNVTPSIIASEKYRISMNDVILAAQRVEDGAMQLLKELVECYTYRDTTREEDAARGIVTTPALSKNLARETFHTVDFLNLTLNGAAIIAANYPHESDPGELGNCTKEFAHSAIFTGGTFIVGCACKFSCAYYTTYMATSESPKYVMDTVISSRETAPRTIIYDAVRFHSFHLSFIPCSHLVHLHTCRTHHRLAKHIYTQSLEVRTTFSVFVLFLMRST